MEFNLYLLRQSHKCLAPPLVVGGLPCQDAAHHEVIDGATTRDLLFFFFNLGVHEECDINFSFHFRFLFFRF